MAEIVICDRNSSNTSLKVGVYELLANVQSPEGSTISISVFRQNENAPVGLSGALNQ